MISDGSIIFVSKKYHNTAGFFANQKKFDVYRIHADDLLVEPDNYLKVSPDYIEGVTPEGVEDEVSFFYPNVVVSTEARDFIDNLRKKSGDLFYLNYGSESEDFSAMMHGFTNLGVDPIIKESFGTPDQYSFLDGKGIPLPDFSVSSGSDVKKYFDALDKGYGVFASLDRGSGGIGVCLSRDVSELEQFVNGEKKVLFANGLNLAHSLSIDLLIANKNEIYPFCLSESLFGGNKLACVGSIYPSVVGEACQDTLEKWNSEKNSNFAIIKTLSGHSLDQGSIHAGLTISNYRNDNKTKLDDMAFAVEPFVTTGVGDIYEGQPGGIYVLQSDDQVRDRDARELLKFIKENFGTLPFCERWIDTDEFKKVKFSLSMMVKQEVLHQYPMLIEKSKKPVSQFENTFVIKDGEVVCTTGE